MQQMEQPIGGVVKCLSNQIRRHLDAAASEAGLVELTGTQGMILHYLLRNEGRCLTQRDVEQRFQLRGATLSRLFQPMEAGLTNSSSMPHRLSLTAWYMSTGTFTLCSMEKRAAPGVR